MGKQRTATEILLPYVEAHLSEIAREITDTEDEILELKIHPDRADQKDVPERISFLQKLLRQRLIYLSKIMDDIEETKS